MTAIVARAILCSILLLSGLGCRSKPILAQEVTAPTFRVMTYNIHHAEGLDKKIDLLRIAEVIKRERADIVALQEVDKGVERTAKRDLPSELAELTGMTCVFSNNYHFQGGEYGNAILSRFPVLRSTNTHYRMLRPSEQRGLLEARLEVGGREIVFMATHIDYRPDNSERLQNVGEIREASRRAGILPTIVCGDFNDNPEGAVHSKMKEIFDDAWEGAGSGNGFTFSAEKPRKRIDYIWVSKDKTVIPLRLWVANSEASDHLPLVGEFQLQ